MLTCIVKHWTEASCLSSLANLTLLSVTMCMCIICHTIVGPWLHKSQTAPVFFFFFLHWQGVVQIELISNASTPCYYVVVPLPLVYCTSGALLECRNAQRRLKGLPGHENKQIWCNTFVMFAGESVGLRHGSDDEFRVGTFTPAGSVAERKWWEHDIMMWVMSPTAALDIFNALLFEPLLCRHPSIAWSCLGTHTSLLVMELT